jgi:hypothetical protein
VLCVRVRRSYLKTDGVHSILMIPASLGSILESGYGFIQRPCGQALTLLLQVALYAEYTMRDSAFIAVLAWLMYALSFYGMFNVRSSKLRESATRTPKQHCPPNFSRFFCTAWLVYVIIFNYLANLHFQPLFVGIQARFYMQPNLLVTASSALMLFQIYRWLPLSHAVVRFSVPAILALSAWQVGCTFPTVNHRHAPPITGGRSLVLLNSRGLLQQRL